MENPSPLTHIIVHNAYEHNLKNLNLSLPKNKLVVITGVSGSGKSTLAFDTIYAEGQRKYIESLSAYARQFLDMMRSAGVPTRRPTDQAPDRALATPTETEPLHNRHIIVT